MLLKNLKFGSETALSRLRAGKRSAAVVACVAVLAGCESLPEMPKLSDFPSFSDMKTGLSEKFNETFGSSDKSAASETVAANGSAAKARVVAGASAGDKTGTVVLGRAAVKRLQVKLAKLAFRPGPADGVLGLQTARAIRRYQAAHGLPVTGRVSSKFLKHLETTFAGAESEQMLTNSPN